MTDSQSKVSIATWGWTFSLFLLITYVLCVGYGLAVPSSMHMHEAWEPMMPGFEWLTPTGFIIGAIWAFGYGWYAAIVGVPLYNYFNGRAKA